MDKQFEIQIEIKTASNGFFLRETCISGHNYFIAVSESDLQEAVLALVKVSIERQKTERQKSESEKEV